MIVLHLMVNGLKTYRVDKEPSNQHYPDDNDQRLYEVGGDNRPQATKQCVAHANQQNGAHADMVIKSTQGLEQDPARHT